jgi:hypothetical protein
MLLPYSARVLLAIRIITATLISRIKGYSPRNVQASFANQPY